MNKSLYCTDNLMFCFNQPFELLNSNIKLECGPETYAPVIKEKDDDFFRNDWTVLAFRAFWMIANVLKKRIRSFCTIGTGIGLDALGAIEAFSPDIVTLSDSDEIASLYAYDNVQKNLDHPEKPELVRRCGNLFEMHNGSKYDLIYENLPNLPEKLNNVFTTTQPSSASFINTKQFENVPNPDYS